MATIVYGRRMGLVAAVGVLSALLGAEAVAQDVRQVRPREQEQERLTQLSPFLELVLLPDSVPFPLRLPVPASQSPRIEQAAPTEMAEPALPVPVSDPVPSSLQARPVPRSPSEEQTPRSERTPLVERTDQPEGATLQVTSFDPTDALPPPNPSISTKDHPAVGAWFGQAIQICPAGVAPSACNQGTPAYTLFMTPTLFSDGLFVADDTAALGGPPDGPHTTAFGSWVPTGPTEFTADYLFMTIPFPYAANALAGLRARWVAKVIDANTMVGWVNAYLMPKVPITWHPLQFDEYPTIPAEGLVFVTSPNGFVTDPLTCRTPGCPVLVLKFTVKRIIR